MSQDLLRLVGLQKSFGGLHVTRDVTVNVRLGEVHAVIGPNGAGKTTLIDQISGRTRPDAGQIYLDAQDVTKLPMRSRARMGLCRCFQISSVLASFTVLQNVAMGAHAGLGLWPSLVRNLDSDPRVVERAQAALAEVGLKGREEVLARALAHGEKRQLELAIALAARPRLILLDEPLAGAGPEEAKHLIGTLARLRGRVTMLLVEHDMEAVFALADRVSVLVHGSVIATGAPAEVRSHAEVRAAYLGDAH